MVNLALSIAVALVLAVGLRWIGQFSWLAVMIPAVLALGGSFVLLGRRTAKKLRAVGEAAQKEVQARRVPQAIKVFEQSFPLARWHFFVDNELHANIGILHYVSEDFDKARPHLEKSLRQNWLARAMLACIHFRAKDYAAMEQKFEEAVKSGKKEALAWAAYAWCLMRIDQRDKALKVLIRAVAANPTDDKLKTSLTQVQNDKKLKMRAYTPQWYQFLLERPPPEMGGMGGRRVVFQRR